DPSEQAKLLAYLNASMQTGLINPLDEAIVHAGAQGAEEYSKVDEIPYDFIRKRLTVIAERKDSSAVMITKGALENVLAVCTRVQTDDGRTALDRAVQAKVMERVEQWAGQGFRVLGLAVKPVSVQAQAHTTADECDMTFMGFLLFFDPPKPKVQETIEALAGLGIQLKVITGDNRLVARHIGQVVGLNGLKMLSGADMDSMSDEALWHAVEETTIFAEVNPNEKERIILALKKRGHVVGYMGDGINDAPSLHSADVGISVANAVDVAREAADLVLLEQDLNVLRQGIIQGRKTFANTLKYIFMATSANFGNMFSMAGASFFLPFLPMLPKQVLLINFLTDLPEMTIASDNVDDVLVERPRRMDIHFIRRFMLVFGSLSSVFDYAMFIVLMWVMKVNQQTFHTGWFVESVLSAGLVVYAMRTRLPFMRSKPSRAMLLTTAVVLLFALYLPYSPLAGLLGFVPLPLPLLLIISAIVALYFFTAEMTKRWFYKRLRNRE
ncbi:MAG: HAD-IC family P-type ATPase, partial [Anaerolineaceae bacterium]